MGIAPPPPETPGEPEPSPQQDRYAAPKLLRGLPKEVILYQYEVCPFCNKARAVLDYYKARRGNPVATRCLHRIPMMIVQTSVSCVSTARAVEG